MPAIVLIMWRRAIAESLLTKLDTGSLIRLCYEPDYTKADKCVKKTGTTEPNLENTAKYAEVFERYKEIHDALAPIYRKFGM